MEKWEKMEMKWNLWQETMHVLQFFLLIAINCHTQQCYKLCIIAFTLTEYVVNSKVAHRVCEWCTTDAALKIVHEWINNKLSITRIRPNAEITTVK